MPAGTVAIYAVPVTAHHTDDAITIIHTRGTNPNHTIVANKLSGCRIKIPARGNFTPLTQAGNAENTNS